MLCANVSGRDTEADELLSRRRDSRELIEVIERIELLQPHEQVILLDRLINAFADPDEKSDDLVRAEQMVAAYRAIEAVYDQLDLPHDQRITAQEFNTANEQLGSDWRWTRVHRAWGSWRRAMVVFMGGASRSRAGDIALRIVRPRLTTDRKPARESLRLWLATNPRHRSAPAYSDWAREENARRGDALKHGLAEAVVTALCMSFPLAVEQVEHEIATCTRADLLQDASITVQGHRLVTLTGVGRLTNRSKGSARQIVRASDFPPWVAKAGVQYLWLKDDVERWQTGKPCASTEGMHAHLVWDAPTLARRMNISMPTLRWRLAHEPKALPPPGRPRLKAIWWDAKEAEAWLLAHPVRDPRQR